VNADHARAIGTYFPGLVGENSDLSRVHAFDVALRDFAVAWCNVRELLATHATLDVVETETRLARSEKAYLDSARALISFTWLHAAHLSLDEMCPRADQARKRANPITRPPFRSLAGVEHAAIATALVESFGGLFGYRMADHRDPSALLDSATLDQLDRGRLGRSAGEPPPPHDFPRSEART
jgi:hypothetical protein